ncbi:MAG: hypothetical protein ACK56I_03475, partial [bacterium]
YRRQRHRQGAQILLADRGQIRGLLAGGQEIGPRFIGVGVVSNPLWDGLAVADAGTKHMVLMDALADLPLPNPAPAEFVAVASLIQQDVARLQAVASDRALLGGDRFHLREIQLKPLY